MHELCYHQHTVWESIVLRFNMLFLICIALSSVSGFAPTVMCFSYIALKGEAFINALFVSAIYPNPPSSRVSPDHQHQGQQFCSGCQSSEKKDKKMSFGWRQKLKTLVQLKINPFQRKEKMHVPCLIQKYVRSCYYFIPTHSFCLLI